MMTAPKAMRGSNGLTRVAGRSLAAAGGAVYDDPMSRVFGLDAKMSGIGAWFGFTSGGTLMLAALMALASVVAWWHTVQALREAPVAPQEIEVIREEPPPLPAVKEPEPAPEPTAAPPRASPHEAPPPPAAPAQAAKVLTQAPDPNEPVDLTGNTIVTGNADSYAGGTTASNGTSATAVHGPAAPTGVPGGTGPVQQAAPAPPSGPDRSRKASLGRSDWSAPFPPEADSAQIDEAYVLLKIEVRADGAPSSVTVLKDPGNGFGREARRYAMTQHYPPALDHDGNPMAGTFTANVHFQR
jgi:periplasmic protein TonB